MCLYNAGLHPRMCLYNAGLHPIQIVIESQ